jgi:hypothetical protein
MLKFPLSGTALIICSSVLLSSSAMAQTTAVIAPTTPPVNAPNTSTITVTAVIAPTTPTTPPVTAPNTSTTTVTAVIATPPVTAPNTSTTVITTPTPTTTPTTTVSAPVLTPAITTPSTSSIPGLVSSGGPGDGRTVAFAIIPFAAVAATYFLAGHHQIEIDPYSGFYWPRGVGFGGNASVHLRDEGIYGVRVGAFINDKVEIEGNLAYVNHFESRNIPTVLDQVFGIQPQSVWGLIYDVNGVWNFTKHYHVSPYVVGGVGGLSTQVRNANAALIGGSFFATNASGNTVLSPTRTVVVQDNSAFFSFNYGGGIKALNLWGPVGFRADIRGRTFPNFRGESLTWPEATAGLTFSFGEK